MRFTAVSNKNGVKIKKCKEFGGCNFTASCKEGEFSLSSNLSSRRFPALSPRQARYKLNKQCTDFYMYNDSVYYVSGGKLYKDKREVLTLADGTTEKRAFSVVGSYLCVFPDRQYYNISNGTSGSLIASVTDKCSFGDGTRFGVHSENNCITCADADLSASFRPGDGIKVTGSVKNDGYYVIREVEGAKLMFDENSFEEETAEHVTISRDMPLLKYTFECNNRLWGIYNNAIYASKLGDPFNFNVFDGISTDSYYKEVYSSGVFTAAAAYGVCPVFFKENMIYRVFGDMPSGFYVEMREAPGVSYGCHLSLANVKGSLVYAGSDGIYSYDSSYPVRISGKLGNIRPGRACGGSDGERYYISMSLFSGVYPGLTQMLAALEERKSYVYDFSRGTWNIIDTPDMISRFQWGIYGSASNKPNMFALDKSGVIFTVGDEISGTPNTLYFTNDYEVVSCEGVSGEWSFDGAARLNYVAIEAELGTDSELSLYVSFDGKDFVELGAVFFDANLTGKRRVVLPAPRNRLFGCRLKYRAKGDFTLYSVEVGYTNSASKER